MLLIDRLKKALEGEGGSAVVATIERESEERAAAVRARRELGETIAAAEHRKKIEWPPLEAVRVKAVAAFDEARRNVELAERAAGTAASNAHAIDWAAAETIRSAKAELRRTAERWLYDAVEHAHDRLREYSNYAGQRLSYWSSEKVAVAPHESDPDYKMMRRHGATYRMTRSCSNSEALAELREAMSAAIDNLERFTEQVEPPTKAEVDALLAVFEERTWKEYAARLTWKEPRAPRYDADGVRVRD
jgi:hypothetical protein